MHLLRLAALCALALSAAPAAPRFKTVVFGRHSTSLASFEAFARQAKQSGATHIVITAEDLPWAMWQMDTPGDPYPAWAVSNVGLLKVSVPQALAPFLPKDYSTTVLATLRQRCEILRKLSLKAAFTTFEPQILPEAVYTAHPLWRGPQVDHPLRSRVPRFAPNIDHPDVLALYRESIANLLKLCPEIEIISLHTNDSGSGMTWSPGLYQGPNGSAIARDRKMHQRYRDFFGALQAGASDARPGPLEIDAEWVREPAPDLVASRLAPGMAVANLEGPNATPYKADVGFLLDYFYPFYPAQGLPLAVRYIEELEEASRSTAPRLFYLIGDSLDSDLYIDIYNAFQKKPTTDDLSRIELLKSVAAARVGPAHAGSLVDLWMALHRAQRDCDILNFGGTLFYIGSVHQRLLTRPFVPFPEELTDDEVAYYRKFQFQARTEERARDLGDIQGTRQYQGLGGMAVSRMILNRMQADLARARADIKAISNPALNLLDKRIQAFSILADNGRNALEYQYLLDFMKGGRLLRPIEFQEHLTDITEWRDIKNVARNEMDNAIVLADLIDSTKEILIATTADESIRILGADLSAQLRRKVKIMAAHWEDYERLFDPEKSKPASK